MARILVVDDQHSIRFAVSKLLSHEGHLVHTAIHGEEALAWQAKTPCDLVITDMSMPVMDGPTLIRRLQEEPSCPPIIGMTGELSDSDSEKQRERLGIEALFLKPMDLDALRNTIRRLTASPSRKIQPAA